MELSYNSLEVLKTRYLTKDESGNPVETPEELFNRISQSIAEGDLKYKKSRAEVKLLRDQFYAMLTNLYFMPNTPTLMNAGKENGQLSACFVIPVEDSMGQIFDALKYQALIHKSGGGTGFAFSRLRPTGDIVKSTMGVASGPVSFMEIFDKATDVVKQGGTRRGANMGILRVDHPDILEFIDCKQDLSKYTNFNISVAITDKFMDAVASGESYDLVHPKTKEVLKQLNARDVFDKIIQNAWQTGEPGIIYVDKINADNPTPLLGEIESTNPCGEVPLLPYEACNLGSINLGKMIKIDHTTGKASVDWPLLAEVTRLSTHFLDNVITQNNYPIPEIKQAVDLTRKVGLGVMGWADMLMQMGISYCSNEALTLAAQVIEFMDYHSKVKSVELAEDRGAFPAFKGSVYDSGSWLYKKYGGRSAGVISDEMWKDLDQIISEKGLRNSTTTCIAPTGTISIIAGASGGIEPLFGLAFYRNIMGRSNMIEVNEHFEKAAKQAGIYSEDLLNKILENHGGISGLKEVPDVLQKVFVTAHDVTPEWHIKMQAIFQLHTDNAVSKTCNFPEEATCEDIAKVYSFAYQNNLKGVTVYRNNSRSFQPMAHAKVEGQEQQSDTHANYIVLDTLEDSKPLTGLMKTVSTPSGTIKVTVSYADNTLCDVTIKSDSYGSDSGALFEGLGRMITLALHKGASINEIVALLKDIRSSSVVKKDKDIVYSTADAIAKAIDDILNYNSVLKENRVDHGHQKFQASVVRLSSLVKDETLCPDCSQTLIFGEGCFTCISCGYSKCQV